MSKYNSYQFIEYTKRVGLAATVLLAFGCASYADEKQPSQRARQFKGFYETTNPSLNPDQIAHREFGRSGASGREGLGASPLHPEGPGNFSD